MQPRPNIKRQFIRHITNFPIVVSTDISPVPLTNNSQNISHGGLSFSSRIPLPVDHLVHIAIRVTTHNFDEEARVAWCRRADKCYDVGIEFLSREASFRARMIEQICRIEQYRQEMLRKYGIDLSSNEAALKWVSEHAAQFASEVK